MTTRRPRRTRAEIERDRERKARYHDRYVVRTYGLAPGQYDQMLEAQGGVCAICQKVPRTKFLSVDHDHDTGTVRALLCQPCNRAIGRFEFNEAVAHNAAIYLLRISERNGT